MPNIYVISVPLANGTRGYLHPNGFNYRISASLVGAAFWNSYEEALLATSNMSITDFRIETHKRPQTATK